VHTRRGSGLGRHERVARLLEGDPDTWESVSFDERVPLTHTIHPLKLACPVFLSICIRRDRKKVPAFYSELLYQWRKRHVQEMGSQVYNLEASHSSRVAECSAREWKLAWSIACHIRDSSRMVPACLRDEAE